MPETDCSKESPSPMSTEDEKRGQSTNTDGGASEGALSPRLLAAAGLSPQPGASGSSDPAGAMGDGSAGAGPAKPSLSSSVTEVELKLAGDRSALEAAFAGPALAGRATAPAKAKLQNDTYYDTTDRTLEKRGVALRVRTIDGRYVQTLKSSSSSTGSDDGRGPARRRGEWEASLPTLQPDPLAFADPDAQSLLEGIAPSRLEPRFTVAVDRRSLTVQGVGAGGGRMVIEAAMDVGRILTSAGEEPISELELELKQGSSSDLYRLGLELNDGTGLRIATRSKADRARDLILRRPPPWEKASKPALPADATVSEAIDIVVRACLGQWLANHDASMDGRDPEGVHQLRVALRRLRTALSLFKPAIADQPYDPLAPEVKWALNAVGPARDWDVFITELLAPVMAARPHDSALEALANAAEEARSEAYLGAWDALGSARYTRILLRIGLWVEDRGWLVGADDRVRAAGQAPLAELADALLAKRHRQALKRGKRFAKLDTERRHDVRIALKKLRYAAEFFSGLYGAKKTKPFLKALAGLQDRLGHLNDVAVAERLLASAIESHAGRRGVNDLRVGAGTVLGWHARGVADEEPHIVRDWEAFADAKPFWGR